MKHSNRSILTHRGELDRDDPSITLEDLKEGFFNGETSRRGVMSCMKRRKDLYDELVEYSNNHGLPNDDIRKLAVNYFFSITEIPRCSVCGSVVKFNPGLWKYSRHCSPTCRAMDPTVRKARERTCKTKYGTDNPSCSQEVKSKMRNTLLSKYGDDCYLKTDEGKRKTSTTLMSKYGVSSTGLIPGIKEKRESRMLERYGVRNALENAKLKTRQEETCISRYGDKYPGTWKLRELAEDTRNRIYDNLDATFPGYQIQTCRDDFLGIYEHENTWKCKECGLEFKKSGAPFCRCQLKWHTQNDIFDYVKTICPDAISGDRTILDGGRELDILIPGLNIAIEYDGLFWHSEINGKGKRYHVDKTEEANSRGVRLIHIFEDEWLYKERIVKKKLKAILAGSGKTIFARKCDIVEVDYEKSTRFMNKYHIQGYSRSPVNLGLEFNGRLVAVCSFSPKDKIRNEWYLTRYATIFSKRIQGGCGKLLKEFIRRFRPALVRTFADRRWSIGGMYDSIGFKKTAVSDPTYWYVKKGSRVRIHRFNLRKDNRKMFPLKYDPSMTEQELSEANDYYRVWDCGQIVYDYIT